VVFQAIQKRNISQNRNGSRLFLCIQSPDVDGAVSLDDETKFFIKLIKYKKYYRILESEQQRNAEGFKRIS